jgi:hypothetical protein
VTSGIGRWRPRPPIPSRTRRLVAAFERGREHQGILRHLPENARRLVAAFERGREHQGIPRHLPEAERDGQVELAWQIIRAAMRLRQIEPDAWPLCATF